jgi:hypothetical protein
LSSGDGRHDVNAPTHQVTNLPNPGIGGWLFVLCGLLLVWQPISTGLVASRMLGLLPVRGLPAAVVVILRLLATGFASPGLALLGLRPAR